MRGHVQIEEGVLVGPVPWTRVGTLLEVSAAASSVQLAVQAAATAAFLQGFEIEIGVEVEIGAEVELGVEIEDS